ncbi:hypothetical protein R6G99_11720, partial [Actinotignum timonense]|nr:hypothetical protein [Actinotignum timonense]
MLELASTPGQAGWCYRNARAHEATVVAALRCDASQRTVVERADAELAVVRGNSAEKACAP